MQLNLNEVNEIFDKLINSEITREEADRWSYKRIQAFDSGILTFEPTSDEKILWGAIQYLYGIDMKVSLHEYMHSMEEIKEVFEEKWKIWL